MPMIGLTGVHQVTTETGDLETAMPPPLCSVPRARIILVSFVLLRGEIRREVGHACSLYARPLHLLSESMTAFWRWIRRAMALLYHKYQLVSTMHVPAPHEYSTRPVLRPHSFLAFRALFPASCVRHSRLLGCSIGSAKHWRGRGCASRYL